MCGKCGKRKPLIRFKSPKGYGARYCSTCRKGKRKSRSTQDHDARQVEEYGYKPGEYAKLFAAQNGRCAICLGERNYNLDSDHDHSTGLLRGQLCKRCNRRLLPGAANDVDILKRAIAYLESPPAQQVLGERIHKKKR